MGLFPENDPYIGLYWLSSRLSGSLSCNRMLEIRRTKAPDGTVRNDLSSFV